MTQDQIDTFLVRDFGLVTDPAEKGNGRSYFLGKVVWAPATTTRILRLLQDDQGALVAIRFCVSSDNNNAVLLYPPIEKASLGLRVAEEIAKYKRRTASR